MVLARNQKMSSMFFVRWSRLIDSTRHSEMLPTKPGVQYGTRYTYWSFTFYQALLHENLPPQPGTMNHGNLLKVLVVLLVHD
jgi:hypothetical protein